MSIYRLLIVFHFSIATLVPSSAFSQQGTIDQLISAESHPLSAELIIEVAKGSIQIYPAKITELSNSSRSLLSGRVNLGKNSLNRFGVAFLTSPFSESPSTKIWSLSEFSLNILDKTTLDRDILDLDQNIELERILSVDLQDQINHSEQTLIDTIGVSGLREILEEQRDLQRSISEQQREIARLENLIEQGRSIPPPRDVNKLRIELAEHLKEAAQVTATADRLTRRKLEAAKKQVQSKIKLVEELKKENPEELAREIIALRKKRRELENRLGKTSTDSRQSDQF